MNKGRPSNQPEQPPAQYQQRVKKTQPIKQYWTEHRITLIAYEAQYIYAKSPKQALQEPKPEADSKGKKKPARKKVNLQYESGFLSVAETQSKQFKVEQLIKQHDSLVWLFNNSGNDQNFEAIKEFVKIMLELKHSEIVNEFCFIYNLIVRELKSIEFSQLEKQEHRFERIGKIQKIVLEFINKNADKFPFFVGYLKNDKVETENLITVEAYCFVAEKFNFNINEYYSQAFTVEPNGQPTKKVKTS